MMEPLPHSPLFCSEGIPQTRKRQTRWQTLLKQLCSYGSSCKPPQHTEGRQELAVWMAKGSSLPRISAFQRSERYAVTNGSEAKHHHKRALSACSQHGANIPS